MANFSKENIPDEDTLYYRIHKAHMRNGTIMLIAFDPKPKGSTGMSVDWSRYSTPAEAKNRSRIPEDNGIVSFNAREVRNIPLQVEHDPLDNNQAHALIFDVPEDRKNDTGIRLKLSKMYKWEISIPSTNIEI